MPSLNYILNDVINGKSTTCCLCFETLTDEPISIHSEVVNNNYIEENVLVSDILYFILGETITKAISTFKNICQTCYKKLLDSYLFFKKCSNNVTYLCNALDGLVTSIEYTTDLNECNSLFLLVDPDDCSSSQYYDTSKCISKLNAANHFNYIVQCKQEQQCKDDEKLIRRKKRNTSIPTEDMLLDGDMNDIKCKECQKQFPSIWNLRNHFMRVHAPKKYKCLECNRSYGARCFLTAHQLDSHCTFICRMCGKIFNNKHTLKCHEQSHNWQMVCQDCGRAYKSRTTFRKHIEFGVCGQKVRASPSEAKFTCDYCNKKYTQKVSLRVHIQFVHGNFRGHECKWCKKKFWAISRLNAHIVKHTKERKFICEICNGKYVTKESLLYHTRIHTGDKPYNCEQCDERFVSASRRLEHVRRYHSNLNFKCNICLKIYKNEAYFIRHKKSHCISEDTNLIDEIADEERIVEEEFLEQDKIVELIDEGDIKGEMAQYSEFTLLKDNVCIVSNSDNNEYTILQTYH